MIDIDVNGLRKIILKNKLFGGANQQYVDWAVSELLRGVDNIDVCLLASTVSNNNDEINLYIKNILGQNSGFSLSEIHEATGRIILDTGEKYYNHQISIIEIEKVIGKLYLSIEENDWLVILARNAEYATDIDYFTTHFENELKYIMSLWRDYPVYSDFIQNYDRNISNLNMG